MTLHMVKKALRSSRSGSGSSNGGGSSGGGSGGRVMVAWG